MIEYVTGDATEPNRKDGTRIIVHCCNNRGGWGKGFVSAISKKWSTPEKLYRHLFAQDIKPKLGDMHVVMVEKWLFVCNMISQNGYASANRKRVADYVALRRCLISLLYRLKNSEVDSPSIHMPRICCGLGGGSWSEVEPIINDTIGKNYPVTVYDYAP